MEEKNIYAYVQLCWSQHSSLLEGWFHYSYNVMPNSNLWTYQNGADMCAHWLAIWTCRIKLSFKSSVHHNAPFSFSPVITQSYSDTRWPADTDTGKLTVARHEKKKISASLAHLLISNNNLPQQQHPQSRWVPRNARAAGMGGWEQPEHGEADLSPYPCFLERVKPTDRRAI